MNEHNTIPSCHKIHCKRFHQLSPSKLQNAFMNLRRFAYRWSMSETSWRAHFFCEWSFRGREIPIVPRRFVTSLLTSKKDFLGRICHRGCPRRRCAIDTWSPTKSARARWSKCECIPVNFCTRTFIRIAGIFIIVCPR